MLFALSIPHQWRAPGPLHLGTRETTNLNSPCSVRRDNPARRASVSAHVPSRHRFLRGTFSRAQRIGLCKRRLLWRRRRENLTLRGFRFRLWLRCLLGFFLAFVFISHASKHDTEGRPRKVPQRIPRSPSRPRSPSMSPRPIDAPCPILPASFDGRVGNHDCPRWSAGLLTCCRAGFHAPTPDATHPSSHFPVNSLAIGVNASCVSVRNGAAGSPAPFTRFAPCG